MNRHSLWHLFHQFLSSFSEFKCSPPMTGTSNSTNKDIALLILKQIIECFFESSMERKWLAEFVEENWSYWFNRKVNWEWSPKKCTNRRKHAIRSRRDFKSRRWSRNTFNTIINFTVSSVRRMVHEDLKLKPFKKIKAQKLSVSDAQKCWLL